MLRILLSFCLLMVTTTLSAAEASKVVLDTKNAVVLRGEVNASSVGETILRLEALANAQKDARPTYLVIDSGGGSILDGMELVRYLRHTDHKIECVGKTAISMAFVILQSCPVRNTTDDGIMMQHVASLGQQGREPNMQTFMVFIHTLLNKLDGDQAKRIGMPLKAFRDLTVRDWWSVGYQAKERNVVDAVNVYTCSPDLYAKTITTEVRTMFGSMKAFFSACPMVGVPLSASMKLNKGVEPTLESDKAFKEALDKLDAHGTALKQMTAK